MSIPVVANKIPVPNSVGGVGDANRFSLRDQDAKINRSSIYCYIGSGSALYRGGQLPEEVENPSFRLNSFIGTTSNFADREIGVEDELVLSKLAAGVNQRSMYFFGGLEAPAEDDAALMLEFTLKLAQADVASDANDFTGVMAGFRVGESGITVKFKSDGVTRWIEVHEVDSATTAAIGPNYVAAFDWDTGNAETYKLLWNPLTNVVRLYVSQGQESLTSDILLADGLYSDFLLAIPVEEQPAVSPEAFFGHFSNDATSISRWYSVYFLNTVTTPIVGGIPRGGHQGFVATNEVTDYLPTDLPDRVGKAWNPLPDSFGTLGGGVQVSNDVLTMYRTADESIGYYRNELKPAVAPTMIDFRVSGSARSVQGQSTGMEVFLTTDTKEVRFALLEAAGSQYIGLYSGGDSDLVASYVSLLTGWGATRSYRLIVDPAGTAALYQLAVAEEGIDETFIGEIDYISLPAVGSLPVNAIGFLHNALNSSAQADMVVERIRYSTDLRLLSGSALPAAPWAQVGAGSPANDGTLTTLNDALDSDVLYYARADANLNADEGLMAEFRARVDSYSRGGLESPSRTVTGAVFSIDNGTNQYMLCFADAGPPNGRIVFLATNEDLDQNLLDIREGKAEGTYGIIDWSELHMYRFERGRDGLIRLFVDDSDTPLIELSDSEFTPIPTAGSGARVLFGSYIDEALCQSSWQYVRYTSSQGFDVSLFPTLTEQEVLSRFDQAVNLIVEAEDTV